MGTDWQAKQEEIESKTEIARAFARCFIARPDVKAYQRPDGSWYPDRTKIQMQDMLDHLFGAKTMGHYLVSSGGLVKFMAFDIDLEEAKPDREIFFPMPGGWEFPEEKAGWNDWYPGDPRSTWHNVKAMVPLEARFLVYQLRSTAHVLVREIEKVFGLRTAVAYSGNKGVHVYAFFEEPIPAATARQIAELVLEACGFAVTRGKNFYKKVPGGEQIFASLDPIADAPQVSIEVFPKQDSVEGKEKQLGNLLRLPLGVNLKGSGRPKAMFLDVRARMTEFKERDPIEALTVRDQWAGVMTE